MNRDQIIKIADEALDYSRTSNVPLDSAIEHMSGASLSNNGLAAVKLLIAQKLNHRGESEVDAVKRFFKAD